MKEELLQDESPFIVKGMESTAQMEGAGPIHQGNKREIRAEKNTHR